MTMLSMLADLPRVYIKVWLTSGKMWAGFLQPVHNLDCIVLEVNGADYVIAAAHIEAWSQPDAP